MPRSSDLLTAINAAIAGGLEIMKVYRSDDFQVDFKGDDSPLTKADLSANAAIMSLLSKTDHHIISEENKSVPFNERKNWNSLWIVDPLDGTKEFIKRNGEFTVNIALLRGGALIYGVIYIPVQKKLYVGDVSGKKAFIVQNIDSPFDDMEAVLAKAKTIQPRSLSGTIRVVGSKSHMNEETEDYVSRLRRSTEDRVQVLSKGSSLKLCMVAEGEADVYPRFAPTMEWDTAAGQAICEAAGVVVLQKDSGKPLSYNKEDLLNPHFIVKTIGSDL